MKKSRRTYNGVHLNKKSNTQDVVEQSLTYYLTPFHKFSSLLVVSIIYNRELFIVRFKNIYRGTEGLMRNRQQQMN